MIKITEKGQFEATVRRQRTNMPGDYGLIRSKSLAPFIDKKVRVTIEEIGNSDQQRAPSKKKA